MNRVLIMLSTYNGEKYLSEQLDSLYAQEGVEIHILVRDDGSKDDTIAILEEYNQIHHNITIFKDENIGATRSFHQLIQLAVFQFSGYDYYSFCDQDDVWYSDKLYTACRKLEAIENMYKLYFCDPEVVDEYLFPKTSTNAVIRNNFYGNVVASHILGCTMVLNYSLLEIVALLSSNDICNHQEAKIPLHDGWAALVAYALDAGIVYDQTRHIKYRQHGRNVVGAGQSSIAKLQARINRYKGKGGQKQNKCLLLYQLLANDIDEVKKDFIVKILNYKENIKDKISLLFDKRMYQYDATTNLGVAMMILLNKF